MQKWLYHAKHKAQIIETDDVDMDELYEDGWKDRPVAQAVEEKQEQSDDDILPPSIELTMDQANDLVDNGIIEADEGIEIIITDFAPKQEQPEGADNVQDLNPDAQSESEGGDNEAPGATDSLLEQFKEDPYSLNKDEHVILGKSLGIQTMISSWAEKTLIAKIQEQLDNGDNEATD